MFGRSGETSFLMAGIQFKKCNGKYFYFNLINMALNRHLCERNKSCVAQCLHSIVNSWYSLVFQACPLSSHPSAARFLHHPLPVCLSSCRDTLLPELGYLHSSIMTLSINRHCAKSEANVCKQQHKLCGCVRGQKRNIKTVFQMKWNWDFSLSWNQVQRVMENFS